MTIHQLDQLTTSAARLVINAARQGVLNRFGESG
jgi:hypothetical protein